MELNVFLGYPKRGIAHSLNPSRHDQYPFDSLNQNNLAMVFTKYPNEDIVFILGFVRVTQYLFQVSKDMIWSLNYFKDTQKGVLHNH
jgi:hypothetical protein